MTVKIRKIPIKSYILFFSLLFCTVCRRRFCVDGTLASDFRNDRMRIRQRFIVPTWNCALFASSLLAAISLVFTEGNFQTGLYECEKMLLILSRFFGGRFRKKRFRSVPGIICRGACRSNTGYSRLYRTFEKYSRKCICQQHGTAIAILF